MKRKPDAIAQKRRAFIAGTLAAAGLLGIGAQAWARAGSSLKPGTHRQPLPAGLARALRGGLQPPDANGIRLLPGFSSRIVARSGEAPVPGGKHLWHSSPDGGACFAMPDGGWVYVSNAERSSGAGGVGALRFDCSGNVVDSYSICSGTSRNCAGGVTPWGTWITCEEVENGRALECDPTMPGQGVERAAMGWFYREAVAFDPEAGVVYQTEDRSDGGFYRFVSDNWPSLDSSTLQIAQVIGADPGSDPDAPPRSVVWLDVPNPNPGAGETLTRYQVAGSSLFRGGEGVWTHAGQVYFTTKVDNRVWAYDIAASTVRVIYDNDWFADPVLTGVDNVVVSAAGEILVSEDGGDMQIVVLGSEGEVWPLVQIDHSASSEVTGPAFSPDGRRLYFSSQRGVLGSSGSEGMTFELSGPFAAAALFRNGFDCGA